MMNDNIVVTGLTGFVGKNLKTYLECDSMNICSLSLRDNAWENQLPVKYKAFIHLAGKAHDLKNVANSDEYFFINFELTKKVFDKFLESSADVFIFVSSVKAAADTVDQVLKETDKENPQTAYGKSKRKAEEYILQYTIGDKRIYILRPCMIHGPGNKGNLNMLFNFAKKRIPYPLASFNNKRSFLSVENLCFVIKELINNKNIQSGIYNIADDEALSTNEVMFIAGESLNIKIKMWKIPSQLIKYTAKIGDCIKLPINSQRLQKLTENYVVDNNKILSVIGKPLPLSAREGLIKTFKSFNAL